MISRYRDGSGHHPPAGRRAWPARALMIVALALLMIGLQPWNHGFAANAPAVGAMECTIGISADHGDAGRGAGIPIASHCLLHAGCAVSSYAEDSMRPVAYPSDWPAFIANTDIGQRSGPDPKPPKFQG